MLRKRPSNSETSESQNPSPETPKTFSKREIVNLLTYHIAYEKRALQNPDLSEVDKSVRKGMIAVFERELFEITTKPRAELDSFLASKKVQESMRILDDIKEYTLNRASADATLPSVGEDDISPDSPFYDSVDGPPPFSP